MGGSPDRCDGDQTGMKGRCPPMLGPPQPFTMRPASTVGTRVSLLPSPTPNSCSFPELSRLVGGGGRGRKRVRLQQRPGRDAEAEAEAEGCDLCLLTRDRSPSTPSLSGRQTQGPESGDEDHRLALGSHASSSDPFSQGTPTLNWGTPFAPQQDTFTLSGPHCAL